MLKEQIAGLLIGITRQRLPLPEQPLPWSSIVLVTINYDGHGHDHHGRRHHGHCRGFD